MAKKNNRTFQLDFDTFQKEMFISTARTKLLELEWVNQKLIEHLFEKGRPPEEAIVTVRNDIYDRIESYKDILVKAGAKNEVLEM